MSYFAFDPSPEKAAEVFNRFHTQIRVRGLRYQMKSPAPLAILFRFIGLISRTRVH
jgi:hypothetical protein